MLKSGISALVLLNLNQKTLSRHWDYDKFCRDLTNAELQAKLVQKGWEVSSKRAALILAVSIHSLNERRFAVASDIAR